MWKKCRRDKKVSSKKINKDFTEDQKSVLSNAMKLFDIRNVVAVLFKNGFIRSLDFQGFVGL